MIKRTVEISTAGCYIHTRHEQLLIEKDGQTLGRIPLEDLGVLIFDSPQLTLATSVMRKLAEVNVVVVFTDDKHLPACLTVPFSAHTIQTKVLNSQVSVSLPTKKRLWSNIISAKISNQSRVLEIFVNDASLKAVSRRVRSGDPDNIEAFAAKIYWKKLFGSDFRRTRFAIDQNKLLNYGYAIIRAATARAIVGTGLHPGLGIHHKNQYNPFPLADDLMEPLRPFVDACVYKILSETFGNKNSPDCEIQLDRQTKQRLLSILSQNCIYEGRNLPLQVALSYYAASVKQIVMCEAEKPNIPKI